MADFGTFLLQLNTGTGASGTSTTTVGGIWTPLANGGTAGANELRFTDSSSDQHSTASASWPFMTRPGATGQVNAQYAFTADTTGLGYLNGAALAATWANANFNDKRWVYDSAGTFASAPIFTAYTSSAHGTPGRGDNSILGGNTTDTGGTARSYMKANCYGTAETALTASTSLGGTGQPAAAATNAPVVTDGATGSLTTSAAAWNTNYQGLQGDTDFITFTNTPATPTATQFAAIRLCLTLFTGPNMATGTYQNVISVKYTFV